MLVFEGGGGTRVSIEVSSKYSQYSLVNKLVLNLSRRRIQRIQPTKIEV